MKREITITPSPSGKGVVVEYEGCELYLKKTHTLDYLLQQLEKIDDYFYPRDVDPEEEGGGEA